MPPITSARTDETLNEFLTLVDWPPSGLDLDNEDDIFEFKVQFSAHARVEFKIRDCKFP